jgi:hypothetical protein
MSSQATANPQPGEPRYVSWRGELIARLALTRAGLVVQDAPRPFDLLAHTDGFYFLVEVKAYSSMRGHRRPLVGPSADEQRWPLETSVLRAAGQVNLPVVLFVVDADREVGRHARLDRVPPPPPSRDQRTTFISLPADRDLSPKALTDLVSELRQDWAVSRRPA